MSRDYLKLTDSLALKSLCLKDCFSQQFPLEITGVIYHLCCCKVN